MNTTGNVMGDQEASANLAVRDLAAARKFYEKTLGLVPVSEDGGEVVVYRSGTSTITVYRSEYAGTNKATAVTWMVKDVVQLVRALKAKGINFEHYDMPGMRREGDIHIGRDVKMA